MTEKFLSLYRFLFTIYYNFFTHAWKFLKLKKVKNKLYQRKRTKKKDV